jgi:hypothetical protein
MNLVDSSGIVTRGFQLPSISLSSSSHFLFTGHLSLTDVSLIDSSAFVTRDFQLLSISLSSSRDFLYTHALGLTDVSLLDSSNCWTGAVPISLDLVGSLPSFSASGRLEDSLIGFWSHRSSSCPFPCTAVASLSQGFLVSSSCPASGLVPSLNLKTSAEVIQSEGWADSLFRARSLAFPSSIDHVLSAQTETSAFVDSYLAISSFPIISAELALSIIFQLSRPAKSERIRTSSDFFDSHKIQTSAIFVPTAFFSASHTFTAFVISDPPLSQEFGADSASGQMSPATVASVIVVMIIVIAVAVVLAVVFRRKCKQCEPETKPSTGPDGTSAELGSGTLDDPFDVLSCENTIEDQDNAGSDAIPFDALE